MTGELYANFAPCTYLTVSIFTALQQQYTPQSAVPVKTISVRYQKSCDARQRQTQKFRFPFKTGNKHG